MATLERLRRLNPTFVGYLFLVLIFTLAVFRLEQIATAQAASAARVSSMICEATVTQNQTLLELVSITNDPVPIPDDASEPLRDYLEDRQERRELFQERAIAILSYTDCEALIEEAEDG